MEITLEKIELVKDRTGVSYAEAKEALEAADGSVVDAIISIEETIDRKDSRSFSSQGTAVLDNLKDLIKKGNVAKIVVKKDDEVVLNIPVNLGIIGTVVAPWGAVLGVVAAFGFKCVVEVVKDDGSSISPAISFEISYFFLRLPSQRYHPCGDRAHSFNSLLSFLMGLVTMNARSFMLLNFRLAFDASPASVHTMNLDIPYSDRIRCSMGLSVFCSLVLPGSIQTPRGIPSLSMNSPISTIGSGLFSLLLPNLRSPSSSCCSISKKKLEQS